MTKVIFRLLCAITFLISTTAHAEINIARTFSTHVFGQSVNVGAGQYWIYPLPGQASGDVYEVAIGTSNAVWRDISAYILDEENLQRFKAGGPFNGQGLTKGAAPFKFEATRNNTQQHFLVLDNRYANFITKKASVAVRLNTQLPDESVKKLEQTFNGLYEKLKQLFIFKDFDINLQACGSVNASSMAKTGDITICSELVSKFGDKPGVLLWVFMHETGHTLLGLWGLPGSNNEDMADEFASAILIGSKNGPQLISEALDFFKNNDPYAEAKHTVEYGDRHSLSIQRIRNIREHLAQPKALRTKWNHLLYPHMTDAALNQAFTSPDNYDDINLAKAEFAKRKGNSNILTATAQTLAVVTNGCTKDTDCKGDRICEHGACVSPNSQPQSSPLVKKR